jgi:uncharacterized protein
VRSGGYESYIQGWRRRWAEEREEDERLAERARALLPVLAKHLKAYGAKRVFLFGSLAEGRFHRGSDIDLAAEGLPPGAVIYRAASELDELAAPFEVQLVPLEDADESLRRKVLERGVLVDDP